MSFVVRSRRVVTPEGVRPAAIHIDAGEITRVAAWADAPADVVDYDELAILPGIVDTHVHLNEPGRTEWEGFATATRAAAVGGVTTLVDMPLNSIPPTCNRSDLAEISAQIASGLPNKLGMVLWRSTLLSPSRKSVPPGSTDKGLSAHERNPISSSKLSARARFLGATMMSESQ